MVIGKRFRGICFLFIVVTFTMLVGLSAFCLPPQPEYWPLCSTPQPIAPIQLVGGSSVGYGTPVVWNGQDFAMAYVDNLDNSVHFRRFFADGTPMFEQITLFPGISGGQCKLVWNGNGYGIAYEYFEVETSRTVINFCRLSMTGQPIGTPVQVSFYGQSATVSCMQPTLAWSGSSYAVAWVDGRNGTLDIWVTILNSDGTVVNGGESHDILVCGEGNSQLTPSISWVQSVGRYFVVWSDLRNGLNFELYAAELSLWGFPGAFGGPWVSDVGNSRRPELVDTGTYLGLVWDDTRDGNNEIYFARFNPSSKVGQDVRITNNSGSSNTPRILWTGAEYGVFWNDDTAGAFDIMFQRISIAGVLQNGNYLVEHAAGLSYPFAAFANSGYMITARWNSASNYAIPWGCAAVDTPTCPGGFVAYNITGTTATIGWLPSSDAAQDIAYYQVYRNAVPIAKTSGTFYQDTGLSLGATYAYAVQPVNAGQVQNTSCQTTFYVKTNSSLTLTLAKNENSFDAELSWNDAGMSNYNIFRGTSPQVMSQIGATASQEYNDPNVLVDSNIYYYTVDEPGW